MIAHEIIIVIKGAFHIWFGMAQLVVDSKQIKIEYKPKFAKFLHIFHLYSIAVDCNESTAEFVSEGIPIVLLSLHIIYSLSLFNISSMTLLDIILAYLFKWYGLICMLEYELVAI